MKLLYTAFDEAKATLADDPALEKTGNLELRKKVFSDRAASRV